MCLVNRRRPSPSNVILTFVMLVCHGYSSREKYQNVVKCSLYLEGTIHLVQGTPPVHCPALLSDCGEYTPGCLRTFRAVPPNMYSMKLSHVQCLIVTCTGSKLHKYSMKLSHVQCLIVTCTGSKLHMYSIHLSHVQGPTATCTTSNNVQHHSVMYSITLSHVQHRIVTCAGSTCHICGEPNFVQFSLFAVSGTLSLVDLPCHDNPIVTDLASAYALLVTTILVCK